MEDERTADKKPKVTVSSPLPTAVKSGGVISEITDEEAREIEERKKTPAVVASKPISKPVEKSVPVNADLSVPDVPDEVNM